MTAVVLAWKLLAVECPMLQHNHAAVHGGWFPQRQQLAPVSTHDVTETNPTKWLEL